MVLLAVQIQERIKPSAPQRKIKKKSPLSNSCARIQARIVLDVLAGSTPLPDYGTRGVAVPFTRADEVCGALGLGGREWTVEGTNEHHPIG